MATGLSRFLRAMAPIAAVLAFTALPTFASIPALGAGKDEVRSSLGQPNVIVGGTAGREAWVYTGHDYHKRLIRNLSPTQEFLREASEAFPGQRGFSHVTYAEEWVSTPYPKSVVYFERGRLVAIAHPLSPSQRMAAR